MILSRRSCKTQNQCYHKSGLTQFWFHIQQGLFPFLVELEVECYRRLKLDQFPQVVPICD